MSFDEKKNVKGHCPGVVAIMGMSLMLLSYDRGRLDRDETPYSLWEKFIYISDLLREAHLLLKSKGWCKEV